jgi:hypothetical protein
VEGLGIAGPSGPAGKRPRPLGGAVEACFFAYPNTRKTSINCGIHSAKTLHAPTPQFRTQSVLPPPPVPSAALITVRETLDLLDGPFAALGVGIERGEYPVG